MGFGEMQFSSVSQIPKVRVFFTVLKDEIEMAVRFRPGLMRRFISTSAFSSQTTPTVAATASSTFSTANTSSEVPSTILHVSGFNKYTRDDRLEKAFSKFGKVVDARVISNIEGWESTAYGFVKFNSIKEAEKGMKGMNDEFLDGWVVDVVYARPEDVPKDMASPNQQTGN